MIRIKYQKKIKLSLTYIALIIVSISFAFPLFWLFMTSFKAPKEYYSMPPTIIPDQFNIVHYKEAFAPWSITEEEAFGDNFFVLESAGRVEPVTPNIINSFIVVGSSVALSLLVGIWAAYALSRFKFKGSEKISGWILSTRMMPPIVIAIPIFWMLKSLKLIGTHIGLILVYVLINLPFVIWMMRSFFDEIPVELEESILIDGGNRVTVISRLILPLALPGIVATALFCVFLTWTEFMFAAIITNNSSATLPIVLSAFRQDRGMLWGQMSAVIVVALIPLMAITMLLQKQMIKGLTAGSIK